MAKAGVVVDDWDKELLVPAQGRLVYVGQGQMYYTYFHEPTPGLLWPKKKRKKKKENHSLQHQLQRSASASSSGGGLGG
jgi:hypothetical protein